VGVNLIPIVRRFKIETKTIPANDCAVVEGCTAFQERAKLLRFDFLCWNAGNTDVKMGSPSQNPQLYEFSPCHHHYHLRDFNGFKLYDCQGRDRKGSKQAFCLMDMEKISPSAGRGSITTATTIRHHRGMADLYERSLDCQWVDITGLADGDYVLEARTNRNGVVKEGLVWRQLHLGWGTHYWQHHQTDSCALLSRRLHWVQSRDCPSQKRSAAPEGRGRPALDFGFWIETKQMPKRPEPLSNTTA